MTRPSRPPTTDEGDVSGNAPKTVLVVDDDATLRRRIAQAFAARGYEVTEAADGRSAIAVAELASPEYAVVDLRMPDTSGLVVVRRLHELDPTTRIVVLTGYGSITTALDAVRSGAVHYLTKPADVDEIIAGLEHPGTPADAPPDAKVPSLARIEWEHIERVVAECRGNITQAAKRLGLHRRSLQRKLAKYPSPY